FFRGRSKPLPYRILDIPHPSRILVIPHPSRILVIPHPSRIWDISSTVTNAAASNFLHNPPPLT
ncbi:MAG: hypothetical protein IJC71_04350, partial [Clostridia bacterium]|nr:hypothetical protein [Clostridia bacterium]